MTAHRFTPEMLTSSPLLINSIEIVMKIINEAKNDIDEESNMKIYQNCLLHNLGVCLLTNPEITINYLQNNNLVSLITDNLAGKFSELITYRTLRTFFMGMCNLIMHRQIASAPELVAILNNSEILVYFNRILIKLYLLKQLNSVETENEMDQYEDDSEVPGLDTEIDRMISKFLPDPALEKLDEEMCKTDMDYLLNVEVLMAFDFDICNEFIEEINEFVIFKNLLEKENSSRSPLFQGYISRTSESMQKNVQIVIG